MTDGIPRRCSSRTSPTTCTTRDVEDFWSGLWTGSPTHTGVAVIGQPARDAERYGGISFSVKLF